MAATLDDSPSTQLSQVGQRIRSVRQERGITLKDLAARANISVAMLSHVERGEASPSLKTLDRLRIALDVQLASFFTNDPVPAPDNPSVIVRSDNRRKLPFASFGMTKELLSPPGPSELEMYMLVIEPNGGSGPESLSRNGEKAGYVVQGVFSLTVGETHQLLYPGDSFRFDSRVQHQFRNAGDDVAKVIWIIKSGVPG